MSDYLRLLDPADAEQIRLPPEAFAGAAMLRFISNTIGSDAVSVNFVEFEAGARARPHTHDSDQLIFYVSGEGAVAVDGEADVAVPAGTFVVLRQGVPHMHGASTAGPAAHLSIMPTGHSTDFDCAVPESWARWSHDGTP